ncbi:PmoA family protein [Roseibacillus persicicus]|uniref:DUF6807 domain-containing protein n=1 Tax=Roseibacillus persicicus TaxID=454148 RepID=UPI00398AFDCE
MSGALVGWVHGEVSLKAEGKTVSVLHDGEVVAVYRGDQRVPCIYPLVGPTGTNVTRHYPLGEAAAGEEKDHPHHVSFWMAHGDVNGHDFWHGKENRIVHKGVTHSSSQSVDGVDEANLTVELEWQAGEKVVLTEERKYRFHFEKETWLVDVSCALSAVEEAVFGDTKEGTFAIRVTPTLRMKGEVGEGKILDSEGRTDGDCWGKRSKWVAFHGPDSAGESLVVALMDHRDNLRHPTWWHARDYGLLAANPFGQHDFEGLKDQPEIGDFTLAEGKSFTQRYRLVLSAGKADGAALEGLWKNW